MLHATGPLIPGLISLSPEPLHFNPEVTLGTILTITSLLGAALALMWKVSRWIAVTQASMQQEIHAARDEFRIGINAVQMNIEQRIGGGPTPVQPMNTRVALVEQAIADLRAWMHGRGSIRGSSDPGDPGC